VVLGGGVSPASHGDLYPNLESGADWVWHAARLFHASKAPLGLLTSCSDPEHSATSEAEAMRRFMVDLGGSRASRSLGTTKSNYRPECGVLSRDTGRAGC